jgi:hypothetical protein
MQALNECRRNQNCLTSQPPPKPLILAGWAYSSDIEKKERWEETVGWASNNGCQALIDGIPDDEILLCGRINRINGKVN